ncbi:RING/U-box superfamily protein [Prunus dulcis]|uniref:RING/U-box superfamily protein n=1 Tax=Prunus dulcis TaxID=3755 RepID=A0A4Y1RL90_PRUDU|nr:RING/U-box superfamily protein [Prunus dulcis]
MFLVQDEENNRPQNGDDISNEQSQYNHIEQQPQQQQQQQRISRTFTYHVNLLVSDVAASEMKDDAQELDEPKPGPMLYGFHKPPPLDVEVAWTETHDTPVPANYHKEWIYFLNKGSRIDIFYRVKPTSSLPLTLVVAQGSESMAEWIEDPSYVGNLNPEDVEVELEFNIKSALYNTTEAYYKCSLDNQLCSLKLSLLGASAVVITSPGPKEGDPDDDWYIRLSYGPRWIMYFLGSGVMTVLLLMAFRFCNVFQNSGEDRIEFQAGEAESERTPLISPKDDDVLSWGSSYESVSNNEEDLEESLEVSSLVGKSINEGDNNNTQRLCVICFDGPRDCFFLPCGHCAACFTCGTRIAEEAGTCPICRRRMKKLNLEESSAICYEQELR